MRIHEFEKAILAIGVKPREARLERNHVKWFICEGNGEYAIIVYDKEGKALVLHDYEWPEEEYDIHVEHYHDSEGNVAGITIDGRPMMRDSRLDLKFGKP